MLSINKRSIHIKQNPYIIAEISANHGGNIDRAKETILAAKNAGADAVKIQTYTPDTMTIKSDKTDFLIQDGIWSGYSLYDLYQEAHIPFEWHKELFEFAKSINLTIFSTPFDETAIDLLAELETPAFKIASFELIDLPLIKYAASKNKPMLMSTGMANHSEIAEAIETCYHQNNRDILLFHCISSYPAELTQSHLGDIQYLSKHFNVEVGLSDHTLSNMAAILSIALGAVAIEKHFKLKDLDSGPDSSFSITPDQLKKLCEDCSIAHQALQSNNLLRPISEKGNKIFRRSIYFIKNLKKGHKINETDIKRIRPGYGLEPKYFDDILGKELSCDVERGDPVSFVKLK